MTPTRAWALLMRVDLPRYAADVAALAGVVLALAGSSASWALLALVLAWIVLAARGLGALRRALPGAVGPTGTAVLARLLVLLGVSALRPPSSAGWAATFVVALTLLTETVLSRVARAAVPLVSNLPGIRLRNEPPVGPKYVFPVNTCALAAYGIALVARAPGPILVLVAAALVIPTLLVLADGVLRVLVRHHTEQRLPDALTDYRPTFLLHFNAPHGSEHQVAMWLPYLERLGSPYVLVLRNPTTFRDISRQTDRPVLLLRYAAELDPIIVPTLKTAFYVNTSPRNEHMLRFIELNHVQLNHGDSDKAASYRRVFRAYDKNFVAGRAAVDRFAQHGVKVPDDAFEIVGRPQVEAIEVRKGLPAPGASRTVLYAPTWNGYHDDSRYSSLPIGRQVVQALLDRGCTVVFRPHPWCRRDRALARELDAISVLLRTDAARSGRCHVFGDAAEAVRSLADCFNLADAAICDVSSVIGDFLYSEKPLAVVDMSDAPSSQEFLKEFPVASAAYVLHAFATPVDVSGVLDDLLVLDPLSARRQAVKEYYLGGCPADRPVEAFLDAARPYV